MAEKSSEVKAELARKKKKLEELRRNREQRGAAADVQAPAPNLDVENLVSSILRGFNGLSVLISRRHGKRSFKHH